MIPTWALGPNPSRETMKVSRSTPKEVSQTIDSKAFREALDFHKKNQKKYKLSKTYLAIADFSKKSTEKRLTILNLKTNQMNVYKVSHGQGSDPDHDLMLDQFSNQQGSHSTPMGFHKMTSTYQGQHGLSLKMEGLEEQNKNSEKRAIVLHAADYVSWQHPGRSHGCPAVEKKHLKKIIEQLKDGALFYHYR